MIPFVIYVRTSQSPNIWPAIIEIVFGCNLQCWQLLIHRPDNLLLQLLIYSLEHPGANDKRFTQIHLYSPAKAVLLLAQLVHDSALVIVSLEASVFPIET
jgi:hypothetical protein